MVWVKRLGLLLAALVVLIVAAIIYVVVFVDPNQFKGELQKIAKEKANVSLRMDGDIAWSIYPQIGLSLENFGVSLGNDPELMSFSKAEFGVQLLPLFQQRIAVDTVRLVDLTANLKVDKNGNPNWQVQTAGTTPSAEAPATDAAADNSFTIPDIALDELALVNAHIVYEDARTGMRSDVVSNVTFNDVRLDEAWPMKLDAKITQSNLDGSNPLTANVDFGADFTLFAERQSVSLANLALNGSVSGASLPASPLNMKVNVAQLDFDLPQENAALEGLTINTLGMNIKGQVNAFQVLTAPEFTAVLDVAEFSPKKVLSQLNVALPEMADDSVLEKASVSIAAEGSTDSIKAQPISINFDDTTIEANALLNLSPLNWDIAIAGKNLDLDRYLPPVQEGEQAATTTDSGSAQQSADTAAQDLIPVDLVRSLNGHVGIAFDNVKVKNLQLDKLELDSTQTNGKVRIAPAQVTLYDGVAKLQAQLDVTGSTPRINVSPSIDSVQILPLMKDFMALEKIRGATNLTGDLSTRGNRTEDLIANLNGDLLVNINDGALIGTNYTEMVCKGIALVRTESLNEESFNEDTPFETMRIPAKIVNGQVSTPGLRMQSLTLGVTGDGVISLPTNTLKYETRVALVGSGLDESCVVNEDVANVQFPIVCEGNFMDDAAGLCRPDVKGFVKAFADQELDQAKAAAKAKLDAEKAAAQAKLDAEKARLEEKKDEAKQELQDKLKGKLNNLFN
ncbi:putative assembly protein [Marinomonas aquimarina]|uniref:Putative assembly protein n=1 Tax=Marinomonas aquimarina TaxID=295068 RepID=A0A1A8TN44_9GAMM|nr:AsmA family protein [Marinomonas aquimarina]SBS35507.1 putative assembly protein [Marinomonas aquimarina]